MQDRRIVLKFGGTSVKNAESWEKILEIILEKISDGSKPFVVCSALSQVSNMIDLAIQKAIEGDFEQFFVKIVDRHQSFIDELGLEHTDVLISEDLDFLKRMLTGISLIGDASPRLRASLMARGELMLSQIARVWLQSKGLRVGWCDARDLFKTTFHRDVNSHAQYLSQDIDLDDVCGLERMLAEADKDVVLTQGFIASNRNKETVLLGRGGSDTSATSLAAMIQAEKVEIWTDVPGMFTANPKSIPGSFMLKELNYEEASELATSGAKVLHPKCLEPLKSNSIPVQICWTARPDFAGTLISDQCSKERGVVKAVLSRSGIQVITLETLGMWQEVGFLSEVFDLFAKYGVSVDLVATSQTSLSVSLDDGYEVDPLRVRALIEELGKIAKVKFFDSCAAISLVGCNIRSILHKLGPALEVFEEKNIYMLSQAASDLNFTFVVEESEADKLVRKLHSQFFDEVEELSFLGSSWQELFINKEETSELKFKDHWWYSRRDQLVERSQRTPSFVYDLPTVEKQIDSLVDLQVFDRINYALKANSHLEIAKLVHRKGLSFDCVSLAEIEYLLENLNDLHGSQIIFTPNFAPIAEYRKARELGAHLTLDNIHPLLHHPDVFAGGEILLRLDPGQGQGHHRFVQTAGVQSKFGIALHQLEQIRPVLEQHEIRVVGLHAHLGSGIKSAQFWVNTAAFLAEQAKRWPDCRILDIGGGLAVKDKWADDTVQLDEIAEKMNLFKQAYPQFELWIEPGRFLVAESGVLIARVTQVKDKGSREFLGVDCGMNSLIRPPLYGAYHEIVNLSRLEQKPTKKYDVVGPICESGDVLGRDRWLPESSEGDLLMIANAGAYGRVMSSYYNMRSPAQEMVISGK